MQIHAPLAAIEDEVKEFVRVPFVRLVEDFLDRATCAALTSRIRAERPAPAPISTFGGAVLRPDVRNNERVIFDDVALAEHLFQRARPLLPAALPMYTGGPLWHNIGLNERFRGYRYRPGQRFAPHTDGWFSRSERERSALTFLVYLDEGCEGGETRLLDWDLVVRPRTGTLFVFDHHVLHEGAVVTQGEKHVLRTDVMYRRA